jgi:hypothetical protein
MSLYDVFSGSQSPIRLDPDHLSDGARRLLLGALLHFITRRYNSRQPISRYELLLLLSLSDDPSGSAEPRR